MSGLANVPGSLGGLVNALAGLGGAADGLAARRRELEAAIAATLSRWTGPRRDTFAAGGDDFVASLANLATVLGETIDHLERQRELMRLANSRIEALRIHAARIRRDADSDAAAAPGPRAHGFHLAADHAVLGLEAECRRIHHEFEQTSTEVAQAINAATSLLVPGADTLSEDAIRRTVLSAAPSSAWSLWTMPTEKLEGWQVWATDFGLAAPHRLDPARARGLAAELQAQISAGESLTADRRAEQVRAWAQRHSEPDLVAMAIALPGLIGNLDGMPNRVRYLANRQAMVAELRRNRFTMAGAGRLDPVVRQRLHGRIGTLEEMLGDDPKGQPIQVLAFRPPTLSGAAGTPGSEAGAMLDDGRIAVVVGDLDHARRVGVLVPGIRNRIDNFSATLTDARATQSQVDDSATVAWLGYDAPEWAESVRTDTAELAGRDLRDFVLGTQRAEGSQLALIGHSYGSLVVARALQAFGEIGRRDRLPDRTVLAGVPGLPPSIKSASDLGVPTGYPVFVLRSPGDAVSMLAPFGSDPVELDGFSRLDTDPVGGHSSYFEPGSLALANIGAALDGDPRDLVRGGPPLEAGLLGRYNTGFRKLVAQLQAEAPADSQAEFLAAIEGFAQRVEADPRLAAKDPKLLITSLHRALHDSDLDRELTSQDVARAIRRSGLIEMAAADAGDRVARVIDDQDWIDDLEVDLKVVTVPVPDWLNEGVAANQRMQTIGAVELLAQGALLQMQTLPDVRTVVDAGYYTMKGGELVFTTSQWAARGARRVVSDSLSRPLLHNPVVPRGNFYVTNE